MGIEVGDQYAIPTKTTFIVMLGKVVQLWTQNGVGKLGKRGGVELGRSTYCIVRSRKKLAKKRTDLYGNIKHTDWRIVRPQKFLCGIFIKDKDLMYMRP